jgi:hypothetical protein
VAVASCRAIPPAADELTLDRRAHFRLSGSLSTGEVDEDINASRRAPAGADGVELDTAAFSRSESSSTRRFGPAGSSRLY